MRISSTNTEQQRISLDNPNTRDFHFFSNLRSSVESFSLLLWVFFFFVHMFLFKLSITNFVIWSLPFLKWYVFIYKTIFLFIFHHITSGYRVLSQWAKDKRYCFWRFRIKYCSTYYLFQSCRLIYSFPLQ